MEKHGEAEAQKVQHIFLMP